MHNFRVNYNKVLKGLGFQGESFLIQIRKPRLSDLGIIALTLTAEYMSIDSEHQLFRMLPADFHLLIERTVYNRRKRRLFNYIDLLRQKLVVKLGQGENCFIVDNMPLEVCRVIQEQAKPGFVKKRIMPGRTRATVLLRSCIIMAINCM